MNAETSNVADWIESVGRQLSRSGLHFGHGTDNARDEAAWLVLHVLGAPLDGSFRDWGRTVSAESAEEIQRLAQLRCTRREPLAYLIGSAWFAGLEFRVTRSVLVPRSPIAELVLDRYRPWVRPSRLRRMLDLCTGSGCIAIASAVYLPQVRVDASDISVEALQLASDNARRHGVSDRLRLIESDLFRSIDTGRYDLIVANPPYVPQGAVDDLPPEYRAEPRLGLASGRDGLDAALSILVDAPAFLGEDGVLICEVGESGDALARLLPDVPFLWLEFERGGSGVFLLTRAQLERGREELAVLIGERQNVA